jgi:hypothetical protein
MKGHEVTTGAGNYRCDQGDVWIIEHDRTRRVATNRKPISTIPHFSKLAEFELLHFLLLGV